MDNFDNLPFSFVMDLHRQKLKAEKNNDLKKIHELENLYPELFSVEFEDFISNVEMTIGYISHKYGNDFSGILESNETYH